MNERIKELESQCWEPRQYGPDWFRFNSKKFAELIVRECAELNFRELGLSGSDSFDVSRMIKQHFGVK